ncbi:hypothetical protein [Sphingomonas sp. Y38-1Y]|jgi:hypothetical protein|uniref:hypothetical protein n=1 Tax=Sphingomonas sp. Y38-1Y TaxID=3078265 RepID=UPI0028E34050|nr:hypothetical protein [Sphingomonas sp. Y38-1Y]
MNHSSSTQRHAFQRFQVAPPSAPDRLSETLRCAYGRGDGLPDDMVRLLRELDQQTVGRS